nr:uncharacterized protein LOC121469632 [Taeniopygia guttata]
MGVLGVSGNRPREAAIPRIGKLFWGKFGIFSLWIPVSILLKAPGMELFLLGSYFGGNLGYFPMGSPFPSSPRLQGWNCSSWEVILGKFGIFSHGISISILPKAPGMELLHLGSYFGGNLGYFPVGSSFPSSPRLQGWNCSSWEVILGEIWDIFPWDPHFPSLQSSGDRFVPPGKLFQGKFGIFSHGISISILPKAPGMELLLLGSYFGGNLGYLSVGFPTPSSPRLQGWNCSFWEVNLGEIWDIFLWDPRLRPPQGSRDGIVPPGKLIWGKFGIFSRGIPVSVLPKAPGMELLLLGIYFGGNLGYFIAGSPSPSSPKAPGMELFPQSDILGEIWDIFPRDPHFHSLQSSGDRVVPPGKLFWGKFGIFSCGIPISILPKAPGMELFPSE